MRRPPASDGLTISSDAREWDPLLVEEVRTDVEALPENARWGELLGSALDAAIADPRWRAGGRGAGPREGSQAVVSRRPNAGGAAMGAGAEYQARVSAWAAVHMLAEEDAEPPFRLTAPVARIACEGSEPVDDLIVTTRDGHNRVRAGEADRFP